MELEKWFTLIIYKNNVIDIWVNKTKINGSTLIAHVKSIEGYITTYQKAWLAKQKAIENIYDNWERSFHDLSRLLQAMH